MLSKIYPDGENSALMVDGAPLILLTGKELARAMGYSGVTQAFRAWCRKLNITPVPGRTNFYDPKLVRDRLDESQGIKVVMPWKLATDTMESHVTKRRKRRAEEQRTEEQRTEEQRTEEQRTEEQRKTRASCF